MKAKAFDILKGYMGAFRFHQEMMSIKSLTNCLKCNALAIRLPVKQCSFESLFFYIY